MIKKCLFMLLISVSGTAYAVTTADVPTIVRAAQAIDTDARNLSNFSDYVTQIDKAGYRFAINFSSDTVPLTALQKQDLVASYAALKAKLQADVNALP